MTFLLNGIFWNEKIPRLLTKSQVELMSKEDRLRLITVADVSCDINVTIMNEIFNARDPLNS